MTPEQARLALLVFDLVLTSLRRLETHFRKLDTMIAEGRNPTEAEMAEVSAAIAEAHDRLERSVVEE